MKGLTRYLQDGQGPGGDATGFWASQRAVWLLAFSLGACGVVFTVFPRIDLAASALFYDPGVGFPIGQSELFQGLRFGILSTVYVVALLSLGGLAAALFGRRLLGVPGRVWAFVALLFLLGPGLLVNTILKAHWGRARPEDIVEFGGAASFSGPMSLSDQCSGNCSFVSGEGAGATAFAISVWVIVRHLPPTVPVRLRQAIVALALVLAALGLWLRVATGRHFLSDSIFAVLFVLALGQVLWTLVTRAGGVTGQGPTDP